MSWNGTADWGTALVTRTQWDTYVVDNITYLHDNRFDTSNFDYAPLTAQATADLYCTDGVSPSWVPGGSAVLNRAGIWIVRAYWDLDLAEGQGEFWGELYKDGSRIMYPVAELIAGGGVRAVFGNVWALVTSGTTTSLRMSTWISGVNGYARAQGTRFVAVCVKSPA